MKKNLSDTRLVYWKGKSLKTYKYSNDTYCMWISGIKTRLFGKWKVNFYQDLANGLDNSE